MEQNFHRKQLVHILCMAYSGELAAALAYAGHWRSLRDAGQRQAIRQIEQDEWHHRRNLLKMLADLGEKPPAWRDCAMGSLGCVIFLACFVSGWFFAMYFAGRLEDGNIIEYKHAADHAKALGLPELADTLMLFSAKEEEHEAYFYNVVRDHWMLATTRRFFTWGPELGAPAKAIGGQN
ncbi:MAG: ferritin-like domain-containing protein [Cyanobacteria bacterium SZAS LIN-3]|nr:ferritin-like domain-containing protein [Cyanobacteria bacterium SZAS LIN-3]